MTDAPLKLESTLQSGKMNGVTVNGLLAACKTFNDSSNKCMKTPISLLQEICTKSSISTPNYELVTTGGRSHEPLFVYKCSLSDECYLYGKGASKKKAKHAAALGVLNHLAEQVEANESLAANLDKLIKSLNDLDIENLTNNVLSEATVSSDPSTVKVEAAGNSEAVDTGSNPVGELIEIAQRCSLRPPDFEYGDEEGPPHNRSFLCHAKFGSSIAESASGRSKKIAKRLAALKLLKAVQTSAEIQELLKAHQQQHHHQSSNGNSHMSTSNTNGGSKGGSHAKQAGGRKNATTFIQQIKASTNPSAQFLLDPNVEENEANFSKALLDSLAQEENFKYRVYKPSPNTRHNYVLLALNTNPCITTAGNKAGSAESLSNAIFNVLLHVRIMCSTKN